MLRLLFLVVAAALALPVQPVPPVQRGLLLRAQQEPLPRFPARPVPKAAKELPAQPVPRETPLRFLAPREVQAPPGLLLPAPRVPPALPEAADLRLP